MDQKNFIILSTLIVALTISSFFFLDFGVYESSTNSNINAETFRSNYSNFSIDEKVYFYSESGRDLEGELAQKIKEGLEENSNEVLYFANLKKNFDGPFIGISVINKDVSYNPIFPSASLRVFVFASNTGNTTYFEGMKQSKLGGKRPAVVFKSNNKSQYIRTGVLTFKDSSRGIVSSKAYQRHITESLSESLIENLDS